MTETEKESLKQEISENVKSLMKAEKALNERGYTVEQAKEFLEIKSASLFNLQSQSCWIGEYLDVNSRGMWISIGQWLTNHCKANGLNYREVKGGNVYCQQALMDLKEKIKKEDFMVFYRVGYSLTDEDRERLLNIGEE
jgi:hypothetical protein